ncbi:cation transporter [Ensifer canadensis]
MHVRRSRRRICLGLARPSRRCWPYAERSNHTWPRHVAFRLGRRAADGQRSFGYARVEVIAGLVSALTLFAIVEWILYEAIERLQEP